MLSALRAFAQSPIAKALLGILVLAFVFWGIKDVFRSGGLSDAVVKAGDRAPVTRAQFKQIFDDERNEQSQRSGQTLSPDDAVKAGLDRLVVEHLASSESLGALMTQEGIYPADPLVANEIRKITAFFNPITGQFDKDIYARQLANRHMTEDQADAEFRDTIAQRHYLSGLTAALKAPRIYGLVQAAVEQQGMNFDWFQIGPQTVPAPAKPTDAELNAFLKENAAQLTKPEMRQISVVDFSAAKLAQTITAPPEEVQKRFDFEKDTLSVPEKRTVITVAVKDAATGAKVAQALKAGGNPMTVAKSLGAQATSYPAAPKSEIVDRKVADAAFALKAGDVAGPIQGDLGVAVIKVVEITPGSAATLDSRRAKIETEVKQQLAKQKAYELVQKYEDAHSGGAPMAAAAKSAGGDVESVPAPILPNGGTLDGRKVNMPPKVLQQAFSLPQGGESDVIEVGPGEYWVVHVDKVNPPTVLTLDEQLQGGKVRDLVTRQLMNRDLYKRLQAKADALVAEIKTGKSLDAAAAEVGAKTNHAADVTRADAQPKAQNQPPPYSGELLGKLFQAKPGEVVTGPDARAGLVIAKFGGLQEPAPAVLAGLAEIARAQVTRSLFNDFGEATTVAAQHKVKALIDLKQAHQAIGVGDADAAGSAPKP